LEHITRGTRKIKQQTVGSIAGEGDRQRVENKNTRGRAWMKPPKISTHAERQDSQIYESNTPKITARDKNGTKGKGRQGRGKEEAARARNIK
jgi:hypothetical protein